MIRHRWIRSVFAAEIKKMLSYRVDFWIQFPGMIAIQLSLAYFLWDAVFSENKASEMGGYGFSGLMFYYLMVPLVDRILRGAELRFISVDIYEGSLNKYLIYPVPFFLFKYVQHFAQASIALLQCMLTLTMFIVIFGLPDDFHFHSVNFIMGFIVIVTGSVMYFFMAGIFECVAFYADNVWSLLVMLRLIIYFMGGGMIPLEFFPDWSANFLHLTPFPYLTSFPIRAFTGKISFSEFTSGISIMIFWTAFLGAALSILWKKGLRSYTGVGI